MEVVNLPPGEEAPKDSDCVSIARIADGKHLLNGSALLACGDSDEIESVALIGGEPYATYEEAEAAGLAWASEHCVEMLYVSFFPDGKPVDDAIDD